MKYEHILKFSQQVFQCKLILPPPFNNTQCKHFITRLYSQYYFSRSVKLETGWCFNVGTYLEVEYGIRDVSDELK